MGRDAETYARYTHALRDEARPCALVDVDAFDRNTDLLLSIAGKKPLRVATKSLRCPALLCRIASRASEAGKPSVAFMTYSARETAFLYERGLDDFLLAYPIASRSDASVLAGLAKAGAKVAVVADDEAHLALLDDAAAVAGTVVRVLVDVDVAYRPLPFALHLGVRRSPLRGRDAVVAFVDRIARRGHLAFAGIMAYEAQIAGVGDALPGERVKSRLVRAIRERSRRDVEAARESIVAALERHGKTPEIVNGGGTGNLGWCAAEACLTEVTAGSGFLCSHLFDRYRDVAPEPAAFFALDVARRPGPSWVGCAGGGYVASGAAGVDRLPVPWLPEGLSLLPMEGAGEVQTPLATSSTHRLDIGDPVFFRHAKAGELAEHFSEYLLVRGATVVDRAKTYRGFGHAFLG